MTTHSPIRIGVLGAAAIVPSALTKPARNVPEVQVATIAARDPRRAVNFARTLHIPRVHKTYESFTQQSARRMDDPCIARRQACAL